MMKKLGLLAALMTVSALQAMENSNYVIHETGLGETVTREVIYDPEMAEALRELDRLEIACYAREAKERADKKEAEQKEADASFGKGFKKGFFDKKSKK